MCDLNGDTIAVCHRDVSVHLILAIAFSSPYWDNECAFGIADNLESPSSKQCVCILYC